MTTRLSSLFLLVSLLCSSSVYAFPILSTQDGLDSNSDVALDLSLMTFNIRYDAPDSGAKKWTKRRSMVYTVFERNAPDLAFTQEALNNQIKDMAKGTGLSWFGVGRNNGKKKGEYSAIYYNDKTIELINYETFWICSDPSKVGCIDYNASVPRICTSALLKAQGTSSSSSLESGQLVRVYNCHLDNASETSRQRGVELILEHIGQLQDPVGTPIIVAGDFNSGEQTRQSNMLRGNGFVDTFRVVNPYDPYALTFHDWTGATWGDKIDFIWIRPADGWVVEQAAIDHYNENGNYPSDHYPVTARIVKYKSGSWSEFWRRVKSFILMY